MHGMGDLKDLREEIGALLMQGLKDRVTARGETHLVKLSVRDVNLNIVMSEGVLLIHRDQLLILVKAHNPDLDLVLTSGDTALIKLPLRVKRPEGEGGGEGDLRGSASNVLVLGTVINKVTDVGVIQTLHVVDENLGVVIETDGLLIEAGECYKADAVLPLLGLPAGLICGEGRIRRS